MGSGEWGQEGGVREWGQEGGVRRVGSGMSGVWDRCVLLFFRVSLDQQD